MTRTIAAEGNANPSGRSFSNGCETAIALRQRMTNEIFGNVQALKAHTIVAERNALGFKDHDFRSERAFQKFNPTNIARRKAHADGGIIWSALTGWKSFLECRVRGRLPSATMVQAFGLNAACWRRKVAGRKHVFFVPNPHHHSSYFQNHTSTER